MNKKFAIMLAFVLLFTYTVRFKMVNLNDPSYFGYLMNDNLPEFELEVTREQYNRLYIGQDITRYGYGSYGSGSYGIVVIEKEVR